MERKRWDRTCYGCDESDADEPGIVWRCYKNVQMEKLKAENESKSTVIKKLNEKIERINDNRNNLRKRICELKKGWRDDEKRGEEREAVLKAENEKLKAEIERLKNTPCVHDAARKYLEGTE